MFVKVVNFKRQTPRKKKDLARLIRYLLSPKSDPRFVKLDDFDISEIAFSPNQRLLGPPLAKNLLLSIPPWGKTLALCAQDISQQIFDYALQTSVNHGKALPDNWYAHFILSFHPRDRTRIRRRADIPLNKDLRSCTQTLFHISLDFLDAMGLDTSQKVFLVAHADRKHWHVHAVIALPDSLQDPKFGMLKIDRHLIFEYAVICTTAFNLSRPRKRVVQKHHELKQLFEDLDRLEQIRTSGPESTPEATKSAS